MSSTPTPDPRSNTLSLVQQDITRRCEEKVHQAILQKGAIGFDEYMQLALHDSEVGYYCQGDEIFGQQGDFTTVPETSIHLAFCMAHACGKLIDDDEKRSILEIGAGTGKFACDILKFLSTWGKLPSRYYIYESSETLRIKQHELLKRELPTYVDHIEWLENLSDFMCEDNNDEKGEATHDKIEAAIIIANEVLDALPVKCFEVGSDKIHERVVTLDQENKLKWTLKDPTEKLNTALDNLVSALNEPLAPGYQSEVNLNIAPTLASWVNCCEQCVMFLVDYGQPCNEYYHPQRHMGTLRSYFKHQVSEDVFTRPGLQDITADVDFSSVAKTVQQLKMGVLSYSSQRNFMWANNLLEWQPSAESEIERLAQIAQLKQLTLGSAISERFQVMVLGKGIDYDADRFTMRDMRARLQV
jgi:SAM-dependent MidA family methyltransferase